MPKLMTYAEAIRETTRELLHEDHSVILIGEGVPDPKAIFGTTKGLREEFGPKRVFDMPISENGVTGICIGAAISGIKPIMVHQRIDFALYAMDQIVNNAAKWHSMFGGRAGNVPLVIRCIIGRGWGQGNQHSQNLSGIFATIPGLKVVCPSNAREAKGLLRAAVKDPNPVMFIEHRWLHNTTSEVPAEPYEYKIGRAGIPVSGKDITIVSWSYMTTEAIRAAAILKEIEIEAEVIDLGTLNPLDHETILKSVMKTKRVLVVDESWSFNSLASEITGGIAESGIELRHRPVRLNAPNCYAPSTPHLTKFFYPRASNILLEAIEMVSGARGVDHPVVKKQIAHEDSIPHDVPDSSFKGPF